MHSSIPYAAVVAAMVSMLAASVSGQASTSVSFPDVTINFGTFQPGVTYAPPDKSVYLSDLAVKVSSQVANPTFQAEISKIPEAKSADLVSDITKVVAYEVWSGTKTPTLPAWLTALPTTGYAYAAVNGDVAAIYQSELENATPIGSATKSADKASAVGSNLNGKASSLTSSLASKASSLESSITSSIGSRISSAVSTASSTGGAQAQATGGLMAMGAVVGGAMGVAALL